MSYVGLGAGPLDPSAQADAYHASYCRFRPCGAGACPCAAGVPTGTIPGAPQVLPELTATARPPWGVLVLAFIALLALGRARGGRDW